MTCSLDAPSVGTAWVPGLGARGGGMFCRGSSPWWVCGCLSDLSSTRPVCPAPLSVCRAVSSRSPGSVSFLPGGRCLLQIRQMPGRLWQTVSTSSRPGGSPCPLVEFYSVPSWCTSVAHLFVGGLVLTVAAGVFQVIHSLPRASRLWSSYRGVHLCPDLAAGYHESAQPHAGSWALWDLAACAALAVHGNPHPQPRIPQLAPVALWPLVAM